MAFVEACGLRARASLGNLLLLCAWQVFGLLSKLIAKYAEGIHKTRSRRTRSLLKSDQYERHRLSQDQVQITSSHHKNFQSYYKCHGPPGRATTLLCRFIIVYLQAWEKKRMMLLIFCWAFQATRY